MSDDDEDEKGQFPRNVPKFFKTEPFFMGNAPFSVQNVPFNRKTPFLRAEHNF